MANGSALTENRKKFKGDIKMYLSEEEVSAIFSFIRNHERDEIPDDVWELSNKIYEWMYENY